MIAVVSGFSSYREQNEFELRQLLASFAGDPAAVILGDLGTGPALPDLSPLFPNNFAQVDTFDFKSVGLSVGHCTFCSDNPLTRKQGHRQSTIQDHILIHKRRKARIKEIKVHFESCMMTHLKCRFFTSIVEYLKWISLHHCTC